MRFFLGFLLCMPCVAAAQLSLPEGVLSTDWASVTGVYQQTERALRTAGTDRQEQIFAEIDRHWIRMAESSFALAPGGYDNCNNVYQATQNATNTFEQIQHQLAAVCRVLTTPGAAVPLNVCQTGDIAFIGTRLAADRRRVGQVLMAERSCLIEREKGFLKPSHDELQQLLRGGLSRIENENTSPDSTDPQLALATAVVAEHARLDRHFAWEDTQKRRGTTDRFWGGQAPFSVQADVDALAHLVFHTVYAPSSAAYAEQNQATVPRGAAFVSEPEPWQQTTEASPIQQKPTPTGPNNASIQSSLHLLWQHFTALEETGHAAMYFPQSPFESPNLNGIMNPNTCAQAENLLEITPLDDTLMPWQQLQTESLSDVFGGFEEFITQRHNCVAYLSQGYTPLAIGSDLRRGTVFELFDACERINAGAGLQDQLDNKSDQVRAQWIAASQRRTERLVQGTLMDYTVLGQQLGVSESNAPGGILDCLQRLQYDTPTYQ